MTEMNPTARPTTMEHRGLCRATALFGALAITLPLWPILAVIWYSLQLINDDGGAAIAGPAVMLEFVSIIAVIILAITKRSLKLEKVEPPAKLQMVDRVMLYGVPAVVMFLPAEVMALMRLAGGGNRSLIWIGIGFWLVFFLIVYYLLYTCIVYRRPRLKRRTLAEFGILLLHGGLYVCMLQSLSLYFSMLLIDLRFFIEPWTLVFILLFGISCQLFRRYGTPKSE